MTDHADIDHTGLTGVGGGGAPTTADYLVGTTQGGLSAEIVVGATPGGELGGTWGSPTVDATHSGTTHSAATDTHIADTTAAHAASSIGFTPNGSIAATDVQAAIQEVRDEAGGGSEILAATSWEGGAVTLTGPTTYTDFDATNAAITFTAPASGNIVIEANCGIQESTSNQDVYVGFRESTTLLKARYFSMPNSLFNGFHLMFYLTGVTAGSHTYKLCGKVNGGDLRLESGTDTPLVIVVRAAP